MIFEVGQWVCENENLPAVDRESLLLMSLNMIQKILPRSERKSCLTLLFNTTAHVKIFSFCLKHNSFQAISLLKHIFETMLENVNYHLSEANKQFGV